MEKKLRQAVVIIHGIGEQRPLDTLRGFTSSILGQEKVSEKPQYWSKIDSLSESLELRVFTAPADGARPTTDFYEYYWAYLMKDTRYSHVLQWMRQLLFRKPGEIPLKMKMLYFMSWILALLAMFFLATGVISPSQNILYQGLRDSDFLLISTIVVFMLLNFVVLRYLGDAARYLSPSPRNFEQRQQIRAKGIQFLRQLHNSGNYDRIVLVGHSLGSVIGYDIIRQLWGDYNAIRRRLPEVNQDGLEAVYRSGLSLESNPDSSDEALQAFQEHQRNLWLEQRRMGSRWLITDFVTLGSPLAHAKLLMADSSADFALKTREREFPTCPPDSSDEFYSYKDFSYEINGKQHSIKQIHDGGVFSCVRWNNFYYPGDLIGDRLDTVFGKGVRNFRVYASPRRWLSYLPLTHLWYWFMKDVKDASHSKEFHTVELLQQVLDLESADWLKQSEREKAAPADTHDRPAGKVVGEGGE